MERRIRISSWKLHDYQNSLLCLLELVGVALMSHRWDAEDRNPRGGHNRSEAYWPYVTLHSYMDIPRHPCCILRACAC